MPLYDYWLRQYGCTSFQELYSDLESIARDELGLDGVPFPLSALEHPPLETRECPDVNYFIEQCFNAITGDKSHAEAIKLIKYLKNNPPKESFENPKLSDSEPTNDEKFFISHILVHGIDLPGSKHNPYGHLQYYSSFFIDMFFGNYTEFNEYVKSLSKEEILRAIKRREGYCQYSPIFAPILGIKMVDLEEKPFFTVKQVQDIRSMYTGCNENKHLKILKKLIKLGADVNSHDINGFSPLHYAVYYRNEGMVTLLLKQGANPNYVCRSGWSPLSSLFITKTESGMRLIDVLIEHNAQVKDKVFANDLRASVETYGSKDLAVRVREAHPREKEECEKCLKPAIRRCAACSLVFYCTPACQKLDWKFHKVSCQKNKRYK